MPVKEHLGSDRDWFRVLDYSSTNFELKIKETIHMQGNMYNPLNQQLHHVDRKLSL